MSARIFDAVGEGDAVCGPTHARVRASPLEIPDQLGESRKGSLPSPLEGRLNGGLDRLRQFREAGLQRLRSGVEVEHGRLEALGVPARDLSVLARLSQGLSGL